MSERSHDSNFRFLAEHDERLARIAREAELLASISPTACIMQVRLLAELLAKETAATVGIRVDGANFFEILRRLEREPSFHADIEDIFHEVRMSANDVVHGEVYLGDARGVAINYLRQVRQIAIWFHRSFSLQRDFSPGPFVDPPDLAARREEILGRNESLQKAVDDARHTVEEANRRARQEQELRTEAEELVEQLREERNVFRELAEEYEDRLVAVRARAEAAPPQERVERDERMRRATEQVELDELETRGIIDSQLRQRGWRAETTELRWPDGARPREGQCIAIADVPTAAGPADYVLFDGLTPVGIIAARCWSEPTTGGLDDAGRRSRAWDLADYIPPAGSPWPVDGRDYEIPFVFASNGHEPPHPHAPHRGIWFRDMRRPESAPLPLRRWSTPDDLRRLLSAVDRAGE